MASNTSSNTPTNGSNLARKDPTPAQQLAALIESRKAAFALVAGEHFKPERLVKLAHGALARTPGLAKCTPASILVALMRCAELDLEPDGALPQRRMWLVPRWNSKLRAEECTFIMDYRAQIQKARETGLVSSVIATEVRTNDRFALHYDADGTSITKFEFAPGGDGGPFADRGEVMGYFAAARLEGGEVQIVPLSRKQAEAFRDLRAPKKDGKVVGPWASDFDAMAIKTCLRRLWNLLPAGKTEAARRLQERLNDEADIEAGKSVAATAPVELDLGVPAEPTETTEEEVVRALTAKGAPAASPTNQPTSASPPPAARKTGEDREPTDEELAAAEARAGEEPVDFSIT